ncbi:hypothetical protein Pst134EA_011793 [Puccinia striiformis f. sp. tritici]|uniref:hypothetical protein n=1 Tax=Puccinia striiformis f. sp. tritici TaxID=168172 RepID=UPI002007C39A|nr:hypothetical protein Pst134EA_011793 [Puccinia striiformis f. sp. tritici]KAH9468169.1 hypothetical protein Pst134EA_011793 [Puccinia striiformis f. sp. tritici]
MINQSLLTLGRVINALLKRIVTFHTDETTSTLDYALRAKSIKNRPELNNKINKAILINQYVHEIEMMT